MNVASSQGYDIEADALVRRYEQVRPLDKYRVALHLIPSAPCRVLDVGAGSGADAAWFACLGHEVLAVEPTFELRRRAIDLHSSPHIQWMDDCLPHLRSVAALDMRFGFIAMAGVWTHLDKPQRRDALAESCGLRTTLNVETQSLQAENRAAGVIWTWLAFRLLQS